MEPDERSRGGAKEAPPPRILILGVGNLLRGDDGFGVHLIGSLADVALPPNVRLLEAGTVSHQLIPLLGEIDRLIVIDAVEAGDMPGSIFLFDPDDVKFPSEGMASLHQISLMDVLRMAEMTGGKPRPRSSAFTEERCLVVHGAQRRGQGRHAEGQGIALLGTEKGL